MLTRSKVAEAKKRQAATQQWLQELHQEQPHLGKNSKDVSLQCGEVLLQRKKQADNEESTNYLYDQRLLLQMNFMLECTEEVSAFIMSATGFDEYRIAELTLDKLCTGNWQVIKDTFWQTALEQNLDSLWTQLGLVIGAIIRERDRLGQLLLQYSQHVQNGQFRNARLVYVEMRQVLTMAVTMCKLQRESENEESSAGEYEEISDPAVESFTTVTEEPSEQNNNSNA